MENPWAELDLTTGPPYVLAQDERALIEAEARCRAKGEKYWNRYRYRTDLYPDPFTGSPDAPIIIFTLNPGYTDDEKAARWRSKGCVASDDWWHKNSHDLRECYKANLVHREQAYPLFFLDPRLAGSPGSVYYHQQFGSLIGQYGARTVSQRVCIVEYFPYHSVGFADRVTVPSQQYALHLVRRAIERQACIVILRARRRLLEAVPELRDYPVITTRSKQNATVSPGNVLRFDDLRRAIESSPATGRRIGSY